MSVKIAILGSPDTGKTALLHTHLFNIFSRYYVSTLDSVLVASDPPEQTYFDLPGSLTITNDLSLRLRDASTIVICFSLVDRRSLEQAETYWCPFTQHFNKDAKVVVVGCKKDLRPRVVPLRGAAVAAEEGRLLAGRLGAEYRECSALTEEGVREVFALAVELGLERPLMEGDTVRERDN